MSTLNMALVAQARRRPDAPAVVSDHGTVSWAALCDHVLRVSSLLRARGIRPGDRVALLCGNRPAFLIAWLATANVGAVTVSLNTGLVGDGLRYAITQSDAHALLVEQALFDARRADLEPVLDGRTVLRFADEDTLLSAAAGFPPDAVNEGPGSEPVSIIYTSGTTGRPKGVLNCHEAFLASGRWMTRFLGITERDRIMVFLPLFHTNPQMYAVMSALETGCAIVVRPRFSVSAFFDDARRFGCTMFTYVGTVLSMLTSRHKDSQRDHPLTRGVGGGCPAEIWRIVQDRFGISPYELYGMTEVGGWVTGNSTEAYRFGSCGRVRPDVEVGIVDEQDRLLPPGAAGEVVVRPRAPNTLLLGYWNDPAATWAASSNFWFHTGDLGQFDDEGYLYFRGRLKEIIRRGGENISPFDVESALLDHPDVEDAAVVAVPDPIYGEEIKAVVVPRASLDPLSLRQFLTGRIAEHMLPRYVQFTDAIPRTETQKIRRNLLQASDEGVVDLLAEVRHA